MNQNNFCFVRDVNRWFQDLVDMRTKNTVQQEMKVETSLLSNLIKITAFFERLEPQNISESSTALDGE